MKVHTLLRQWLVALTLGVFSISSSADQQFGGVTSVATTTATPLPEGMQRYVIPIPGCSFEFVAKKGGMPRYIESMNGSFHHESYFSSSDPGGQRSLSFMLRCELGSGRQLCPQLLPSVTDLEDIRYYHIRELDHLHPRYYSSARISSHAVIQSQAVDLGQVRGLSLCIGDGTHTLVSINGDIQIGYDPRDISKTQGKLLQPSAEAALPEVLKIIRSIRFLPEPQATSNSYRH